MTCPGRQLGMNRVRRAERTSERNGSEAGRASVRHGDASWQRPYGEAWVLIAAHEPAAMARVRAVFSDGLIPAISEGIDPDELSVRGGLER
jgi:hypothetical protein